MRMGLTMAVVLAGCTSTEAGAHPGAAHACDVPQHVVSRLKEMVEGAERAHLTSLVGGDVDRWMDIQVARCPVAEAADARFFVARNARMDPPTVYVLAVDGRDELYPIDGFGAPNFAPVLRQLLARIGRLTDATAVAAARAYFRAAEGWEPGMVGAIDSTRPLRDLPEDVRREASRCVRSIETDRDGTSARVTALVFDGESTGLECVDVRVSLTDGLEVRARRSLRPRPRFSY
jgi:hypothetical protein